MMGNRGPTTEGVCHEGGCSHNFLGAERGPLVVEIIVGLVGKQQIRGKTWGKT